MSIFGKPIGKCDWCGTPRVEDTDNTEEVGITLTTAAVGIELYNYGGKNVCADCRRTLRDYSRVDVIEDAYQELHDIVQRANRYYSASVARLS